MIFHLYKIYATYIKVNHIDGKVYVGGTSGWKKAINFLNASQVVEKRDKFHHKTKDGFGKAALDEFSTDKDAIRGREQLLIEKFKSEGKSGNIYNGISSRNPKRQKYISAALRIFGDLLLIGLAIYFL